MTTSTFRRTFLHWALLATFGLLVLGGCAVRATIEPICEYLQSRG